MRRPEAPHALLSSPGSKNRCSPRWKRLHRIAPKLISVHLVLPSEQKSRQELTLTQLKEELCRNTKDTIAARPLPHFAREDETKLASIQKVKTISPVPVAINTDGVDMRFDAIVVLEGHFPQGLYLGRQELRCYNIGVQDTQGEARIDERAPLMVAFDSTL